MSATLEERALTVVDSGPPSGIPAAKRPLVPEQLAQTAVWLLVVVCVAGPLIPLLYASVRSKPLYQAGGVFTIEPYRQLFGDPAFWRATSATIQFAVAATIGAVVAGAAFAILCTRTNAAGRRIYRRLVLLPIVLPPLGLILGWNSLYGPSGYATRFITHTLHLPWDLSSLWGMAVLGATTAMPLAFLTCQAALASSDPSLEDAARSAGASPTTVVRRVTLPLLRPAILNSSLLIFALAIETLGIPLLLGARHNINFVASYLYNTWNSATTPDPGSVSAGAMVLLVVASVLLMARTKLLGSTARFVSVAGRPGAERPMELGRWRIPAGIGLGAYVTLAALGPVVALAVTSFVRILTPLIAPWHLLTLSNWRALSDATFQRSIRNSVTIALVGAVLTTVAVTLAALVADRSKFRARGSLRFLMLYPRSIPGIIIGIGFFWSFLLVDTPGSTLRNSIWGVMLALSVRTLTIAYLLLYPTMSRINQSLDSAARSVGAAWSTTMRRIVVPLLKPALVAAFVVIFVSILNDYDPALFLVHPGTEIMGVTMLDTFHRGIVGPVAALAMIQVATTALVITVAGRFFSASLFGGGERA
jgi:iron(III) transport system permease protein